MIVTIGEILADLVPEGSAYVLRPGGAPANVAVNLARWGAASAVVTKVGSDFLGKHLKAFASSQGVDTSCIYTTEKYKTGLVFVFLDKSGERDFTFYGAPSADTMLMPREVKESMIKKAGIVHFGSISTMYKNNRSATMRAIRLAQKHKKIISYDPNVRLNLWEGRHAKAKEHIKKYFRYADIIKISDTELKFLFSAKPAEKALNKIFRQNQLVFVSAGKNGCYVKYRDIFFHSPGFKVKAVDTTGAGDAFMAGVLYMLQSSGKGNGFTEAQLKKTSVFANKKGSRAVTRKGAV